MYAALTGAPLGDDVFGDDPTVVRLETEAATLLGKEAALFVPSGTMGNSIAISLATTPGDEMVIDASAHSLNFEVAGAAHLWGVQAHPVLSDRGEVPVETIRAAVRPADIHLPRTSLVILEQTSNLGGGHILPLSYLRSVRQLCEEHGLHFHLDGARLFNAVVASGVPAKDYAACVDTVMFCISKGLGAPAGSLLCGTGDLIQRARRVRKLLGGGLRQAGVLAACGLHALEHNIERLAEDHAHARRLSEALRGAAPAGTEVDVAETNMVYLRFQPGESTNAADTVAALEAEGIRAVNMLGRAVRFVFHKDIAADRIDEICERAARAVASQSPSSSKASEKTVGSRNENS